MIATEAPTIDPLCGHPVMRGETECWYLHCLSKRISRNIAITREARARAALVDDVSPERIAEFERTIKQELV